jgi:hypothetical protein
MANFCHWLDLARTLLKGEHYRKQSARKAPTMYHPSFFRTKLGRAAVVSIAAMLAMNVVALNAQLHAIPTAYASGSPMVELA